ncbi:MAG: sodium-dependent transporter [Prevotella sp.]|jgi:NSS family neurotransmitter:Na+ symporter|nr:sodium-dependent transporter [Prevotella sp.]MCI1282234.1 sodium-dependent transporter [Prevotella sp.]
MVSERGKFGTKIGVILATAGSAVGLGNIWRFPYLTGQDGGAAFIFIYIGCILFLGIPGMVAEFVVGRHSAANAARAYKNLSNGKPWQVIGYMGVFTAMIILGFYSVVAGWCLQYLFASLLGQLNGNADYIKIYFQEFSSSALMPAFWTCIFILLTHMVVVKGVRKGIEKASNLMMPTLFILLIIIVIASCSLPGAMKGVDFLFHPDFSKLNHGVMLDALGQAFFSLSLGTACLCTYASYFSRQTNLLKSAVQIAGIDTIVAIMAGLMIFPAAFSIGVNPDSGPSLIFITLPNVFQQAFSGMPVVGYIIAIFFYALLVLAALTSTISMHEIGTAFFYEELHISRKKGAWIETIACIIIGILCSISVGNTDTFQLFGKSIMDCCDYLTSNILLPLGSFLTCLFVGWYVPKKIVKDEFTNWGTLRGVFFQIWLIIVRFISPICIIAVFLHQLGLI